MSDLTIEQIIDLYVTGALPNYIKVVTVPAVLNVYGEVRPQSILGQDNTKRQDLPPTVRQEQIEIRRYGYGPAALWAGYGPQSKTLVIAEVENA